MIMMCVHVVYGKSTDLKDKNGPTVHESAETAGNIITAVSFSACLAKSTVALTTHSVSNSCKFNN